MLYSKCFPAWGPYGKKYMGLSRIAEHKYKSGIRFDFTVAPAVFGTAIRVPLLCLQDVTLGLQVAIFRSILTDMI